MYQNILIILSNIKYFITLAGAVEYTDYISEELSKTTPY